MRNYINLNESFLINNDFYSLTISYHISAIRTYLRAYFYKVLTNERLIV